jgi:hypothetical protein
MVESIDEFDKLLREAGQKLVVLEVQSDVVCQTGYAEEAEVQWKADQGVEMTACNNIKHTFVRTARSCPDVVFLEALVRSRRHLLAPPTCCLPCWLPPLLLLRVAARCYR